MKRAFNADTNIIRVKSVSSTAILEMLPMLTDSKIRAILNENDIRCVKHADFRHCLEMRCKRKPGYYRMPIFGANVRY